FLKARIIKI
ncbi:putative acetyltransferase domain protein, partial [Vibrio cholerae O1 str. EC-0051]